ncbi:MAG: AI-2E family transporter [Bdellovibrionales bacterium]|nr:AI-2E family transporter [Bdellovibrionales bacterium]
MRHVSTGKEFSPLEKRLFIGALLLFVVSLWAFRSIWIPVFVSYFLAFLLNPVVKRAERRGFGRIGPIVTMLVAVFALLGAFLVLMVPRVAVQLEEFFHRIPGILAMVSEKFAPLSIQYLGYDAFSQWQGWVLNLLPRIASSPAMGILGDLASGTVRALNLLITLALIPILTFYFLKDYYRLNERLMNLVPRRYLADVREVSRRISHLLGGLIRGQFLVCIVLSAYYSLVFTGLGLELGLLLGIFSGFMNLVPVVGALISLVITVSVALLGGGSVALCVSILGAFLVANLIDTTFLTPKIVGRSMGIGALAIILALLAGGELLGFLGVLLALPLLAVGRAVGGFLLERYLSSNYYREEGPVEGKQTLSDQI